jgi:hypothetical protein
VLEPVAAENGRKPPGGYSGLRLISGDELARVLPGVCRALAEALLARPPYELRWLRGVAGSLKASARQLCVAVCCFAWWCRSLLGICTPFSCCGRSIQNKPKQPLMRTTPEPWRLLQSALLSAVTDASAPIEQQLGRGHLARLEPYQLAHLLALRGMLAGEYGVLAHALQRRHLVDYGVNRWVQARQFSRHLQGVGTLSV